MENLVIGQGAATRRIAGQIQRIAESGCTVLISGETGTGKEVWAGSIHDSGPRASRHFIPVNCAALTLSLAESQLFGHAKGAFTGAEGSSLGVFRAADQGIVFLDEVGEMPLELQPKLLRVLQQKEVTPVGTARPVRVDVQVVAATNRDLAAEVAAGRFREDLYYRLNMVELRVPPLRERLEDLPEFIEFFAHKFAKQYNCPVWRPNAQTLRTFLEYPWPGNIRQLSNVIEQSYVLCCAPELPATAFKRTSPTSPSLDLTKPRDEAVHQPLPSLDLTKLRDEAVRQALRVTGGHKGKAARLLGVHANTLTRMLMNVDMAA